MLVKRDTIESQEVVALLEHHLKHMQAQTPPESVHALDLNDYRSPSLKLWTVWSDAELMGCGALKDLGIIDGERVGEVKSMRTKNEHVRKGVANAVLDIIIKEARITGLQRLSLETGATEHFAAAHAFYKSWGFVQTGPFADYTDDPHSVYFTLPIVGS